MICGASQYLLRSYLVFEDLNIIFKTNSVTDERVLQPSPLAVVVWIVTGNAHRLLPGLNGPADLIQVQLDLPLVLQLELLEVSLPLLSD